MTDIVKVYTGSRKFPIVVGKFTNGKPIPLGPYTLTQLVTGVTIIVAFTAIGILARLSPLAVLGLSLVGVVLGVIGVLITGQINWDGVPITHRLLRVLGLVLTARPVAATGEPQSPTGEAFLDEDDITEDDDKRSATHHNGHVLQPTRHASGHLQLNRDGAVTAIYFVNPLDYGLRPAGEKEAVRGAHKTLIQAVPTGTVFMGIEAPMDLPQILCDTVGSADIDILDEYAEECVANFERFRLIRPGERIHLMCIPISVPSQAGNLWRRLRTRTPRHEILTDEQIAAANAAAESVLSKIDDGFEPKPAPAPLLAWLWEHNLTRGIHSAPLPNRGADLPAASTTFMSATLDEGAQSDRPHPTHNSLVMRLAAALSLRLRPSRTPVVKIDSAIGTAYQSMLTIRSFPTAGMVFPGGSEILSLLDGIDKDREVSADWAMRVERRDADQTVRKNSAALRRLDEQVDQRDHEQSFAQNSLIGRGQQLAEYTQHLEDSDGESEIVFTTVVALGAASITAVGNAVDKLALAYKPAKIEWRRPVGAQIDLWSIFNPGMPAAGAWEDYSHLTASDLWAGLVPFIQSRVGDRTGPIIGVNLLSGHFEPVRLSLRDKVLNNFSGSIAIGGDTGGGKSHFLMSRCFDIVDLGGQFLAIDTTEMGEYARLAGAITDATIVDLRDPRVSFDPLRIFAETPHEGTDIVLDVLLPLLGTDPMASRGILLANLLSPHNRASTLTSLPALHRHLADLADRERGDSDDAAALLRAMNAIAHRAPVLFDLDLPVLTLTTPATVVRTYGIDLPTIEEMRTEHLYKRMGAPKLLGQAMYELTAVVARKAFLRRNGRFGGLITDEAGRMTGSPIGRRVMRDFSTDGRKNSAALLMASQDPCTHFEGVDEDLIPTRFGFRQVIENLARGELKWLGIDPDENPHILKQLRFNTSPMNEHGKVTPGREGECFMRDGRGRIGRIKTLSPARQARIDAIDTTPTLDGPRNS
ncbi:ATP-binding protein [Aldersonia sp. NBC_00410]|uniref:ATP-binding protein n=1 Tax=Aldersonia sp. NBC_00410 TaxID=2975954 RepID=UPI00224CAC84|nr:ATP-binding protein [Aldersonia sp. NBC_00410]MCX5046261.1 ATP-binding protein [Aldersonia sp. NBC_00410]